MKLLNEKILISTSTFGLQDSTPWECLRETGCQIINNPYKRKLTKEEVRVLLKEGVTGIIAGLETLDREILEKSTLKIISRCGSGLSNIDLVAAKELGILVYSTPDGPIEAVAELTLAVMLNLLRMVSIMDRDLHEGRWSKKIGNQLKEKVVLIIGFGRIGRRVSELLKPFNVKILVVDPVLHNPADKLQVCLLEDGLKMADIITLHCNGEKEVIGERELRLVKKGIFLLNAARGGLVNEEALIDALNKEIIKGAWLDTFRQEPYAGILSKYPQVILTPHVGSYTMECRKYMELEAVNNLIGAFENRK